MFGIHDFAVFLAAGIVLNLSPGPDTLYILGRTIAQGRSAGVASTLGISSGCLVHTLAAALGISAVLAASASALVAIRLAGAAYLVYLGVRMLAPRSAESGIPGDFASSGFFAVYRQGFLTNLLNPKVALFFLALVPQFIAPDSQSTFAAFMTLGLCFIATGTAWCLLLVFFAARLGERLRAGGTVAVLLNRVAGTLFIALGIRLAVSR